MKKDEIENELKAIQDDENKLYSFLYDLFYDGRVNDYNLLESVYSQYLNDSRGEIRQIAIYSLLFSLKIQKNQYKEFALQNLRDSNSYVQLRLSCLAGLSAAYQGSKDIELMSVFMSVYLDVSEEEDIRAEGFVGLMKLYGLSAIDIMYLNGNKIVIKFSDIDSRKFEEIFRDIEKIINE